MQKVDVQNPSERKKLILAGLLGIVAIIFLWWAFFGFGGTPKKVTQSTTTGNRTNSAVPRTTASKAPPPTAVDLTKEMLERLRPINYQNSQVSAPEAKRNIFVYYEAPVRPVPVASIPTPTPTPVPPVLLANLSPATVYARTGDFKLDLTGDKFTPQTRVLIDNNELPTRYLGPQQLSAQVPGGVIATPGGRQVMLRSPDGTLYSNTATLNVAAPPIPNYTYVGIIGTVRHIDTAILQDRGSKDTLTVQRGDVLGGRFRVTSISEKELVLVDTNLKIKHTLPLTNQGDKGNPMQRPMPRVESEDDEP
ncbi:MAG: hypothetical protein ABR556_08095 [Pyrinomonadaceae bacterium]